MDQVQDFDIVPTHLAVKAMRDSGYRNAAYAIAELVDNSIQAGASYAEILCLEHWVSLNQRRRKRLFKIAVVDDGVGMDASLLRKALQFGNGSRLDDRSGIGRFGMGLPNSSLSQAQRVEVYTWQNGVESAVYTYLDINEISRGDLRQVPVPVVRAIPLVWRNISNTIGHKKSGTLVVWSTLDKVTWVTAKSIFENSEHVIGRMYRRMLHDGSIEIRMAAMEESEGTVSDDRPVRAGDPLYLMENTSNKAPWDNAAMFKEFGTADVRRYKDRDGIEHEVRIRFSIAKAEPRDMHQPGAKPHGKHAAKNIGVSIMRANRELELQTDWTIKYDPVERWWGIEVDFPPTLDEFFGVTNNKQSARKLQEFARLDVKDIAFREGFDTEAELREAWSDRGDLRILLLDVKQTIESNLSTIRRTLKAQSSRSISKRRRHNDSDSAEVIGTKATKDRKEKGYMGESDADELAPDGERVKAIQAVLVVDGLSDDEAEKQAQDIISDGRKYDFHQVDLQSSEFFTVRRKGGVLLIGLNTNHPANDKLVALLESGHEETNVEALQAKLRSSYEGLKLLLEAWARYEDELQDGPRRESAQATREDWGRIARQFFRTE